MSSGNPYASQSPRGFDQPEKKSRKKMWIIIGAIIALLVIIGAVLGGVLGSRASNDSSSSGSGSSADQANGGSGTGNGNAGAPSGVTNVNSEAVTATNQDRYLAIATDSQWMLPVYPTGVSSTVTC
jgi:flagellar basal body-associated protein FliL